MVSDAPAYYNGRLYLFSTGLDDRFYVNTFAGATWSGWTQIPGAGATLVSAAAVSYNNTLYLFGVSIDHYHYLNTFNGTTWSGWTPVPGGGTTLVADAAAAYNGNLYLFGIGINDHAHYVNTFNGTTWSGWAPVPGGGTTMISDGAATYNGNLYLFGIGINDHAHYVNSLSYIPLRPSPSISLDPYQPPLTVTGIYFGPGDYVTFDVFDVISSTWLTLQANSTTVQPDGTFEVHLSATGSFAGPCDTLSVYARDWNSGGIVSTTGVPCFYL